MNGGDPNHLLTGMILQVGLLPVVSGVITPLSRIEFSPHLPVYKVIFMGVITLLVASRGPHSICLPRVFLLGRCKRGEFHQFFPSKEDLALTQEMTIAI